MSYDGKAADIWALGICLYRSAAGSFPFKGINESDLYTKIKCGLNSWPKVFSKELKGLLHGMLEVNPEKRLTAAEALKHAFFHDVSRPEDSTKTPTVE